MATAVQAIPTVPTELHQPLEDLCDALQRAVDGALVPTELPRLAANAAPMVAILVTAGCAEQAHHLSEAIRYLGEATDLWAQICANPSTATTRDFDDAVYQAYDGACWALTWEHPDNHRPLPAGVEVIDLQAVA